MQQPKKILYIGTYERDYPRNVTVISALRQAGYGVREVHRSVWSADGDKSALISSPRKLAMFSLRCGAAYVSLACELIRARSDVDLIAFGYIGQLDALILGPLARVLGKPILFNPLVTLTDTLIEDRARVAPHGLAARAIRLIDRLSLKLASSIVTDTVSNRDFLVTTFGLSRSNVSVVPVGADDAVFRPRDRFVVQRDNRFFQILFYGNMIPLQGVESIVRAAHLLGDAQDITFRIVGTGQTLDRVRSLAASLNLTNVTFVGRVPYEELPREIARADVVLGIFGDTEKAARVVPNKVYQAMAMGAAIVTRDSAPVREVLRDGESALLIPPADPGALAEAIRRLRDPLLRGDLGAAARERYVATASLAVLAGRIDHAVADILGESSAVRGEVTA